MTATIHELKPPEKLFYFQRWMWHEAHKHNPEKYSLDEMRYQGCRVFLT